MKPLLVLVLLPVLIGVVANMLFRAIRSATLAATLGAPIIVYFCFKALDPDGTWSWLAALLVSPLVIAMALVTVLLWFGRSRVRKRSSRNVLPALVLILAVPFAPIVVAQQWPSKPVKLIAVFPPGGSVDQVARIVAQQLSLQTGQQFIVDNRGGASGSIGTALLAKADPDGYTLGVVFDTHAVNPSLIPDLPFDTTRDLTPIMLVGTGAMALVAHVSEPYKSFRDVVAAAKAKPGSVSYGTIGAGSLGHLTMAQLGNQLGVEFNHIPYRGGGPLMNDAIGDQVPLAIGSVFLVNPYVTSGRLRAIAVTSAKPDPKLPGAEPIANQGVPGFEVYTWWGVFGPANMPPALLKRVYGELAKAVKTPEVADKLSAQGIEVLAAPPEELDAFVRKEIPRWAKVIKDNKVKLGD